MSDSAAAGRADLTDIVLNPSLVVEVLSPSTQSRDRREKAEIYRAIPSLHTILLVAQDRIHIEWFERHGSFWKFQEVTGNGDTEIDLALLGTTLSVRDIYRGIAFA